ncbi:MAG TPA: glycoside hydrolase family 127 protein [Candidatus Hydrogenedentes bacterium]|nr:glycoside hydrolase family 127 protein [Candidatus Hydrogenedentota bacterium]
MLSSFFLSLLIAAHPTDTHSLTPLALEPFPLGKIISDGWLEEQMRIQSNGLSGNLDKFWPDIQHSGWIGGNAEGWERAPYWLDGLIPLAWTLPDVHLQKTVHFWMRYIIAHQEKDGWLGPKKSEGYQEHDTWPQFVILKALRQYYEVTGDSSILEVMTANVRCIDRILIYKPLFDWGKYRWMDFVITLHWLFDRTGNPDFLNIAERAHSQGFSWRDHFENFRFTEKMKGSECIFDTHVVNNAMAVKAPAVWYRQSRDPGDLHAVQLLLDTLDKYHGQVTGIFTGDEHYAGKNPSQGTELCAVVEYLFSLETLLAYLGRAEDADRMERIAFNALPGTFSPDMWAHQYVQQANQVICRVSDDRIYTNNGPDSNLFGLEPNYGCCTSNMHQGWPKFTSHLLMRTPAANDKPQGIAAVAYAPCSLKTTLNGQPVFLRIETEYPFEETIRIHLDATGEFPVHLRIPAWAEGATVQLNNEAPVSAVPGTFHVLQQKWTCNSVILLRFPMKAVRMERFNKSAAISRGPLVYSLLVETEWRSLRGEAPHNDFELYPVSPWNYALAPDFMETIRFESAPLSCNPFDPASTPVRAYVKGRLLPEWKIEHNAAAPPPLSPVHSEEALSELTLIPYGAAKLRVTEFPVSDK